MMTSRENDPFVSNYPLREIDRSANISQWDVKRPSGCYA